MKVSWTPLICVFVLSNKRKLGVTQAVFRPSFLEQIHGKHRNNIAGDPFSDRQPASRLVIEDKMELDEPAENGKGDTRTCPSKPFENENSNGANDDDDDATLMVRVLPSLESSSCQRKSRISYANEFPGPSSVGRVPKKARIPSLTPMLSPLPTKDSPEIFPPVLRLFARAKRGPQIKTSHQIMTSK